MSWISNGGEFVTAPKRYMSLTLTGSTNTTVLGAGNDVFGKVVVTVTGTVTSGNTIAVITPPIPLPDTACVWVSPGNKASALTSGVSTITNSYFANVNTNGAIVIGIVGDTAGGSTASSLVLNYFVAQ